MEYLLEDTEEERRTWELIRGQPALRLLGLASSLKTRLPLEALAGPSFPEASHLREAWEKVYGWLAPHDREELKAWIRAILEIRDVGFQDRLAKVVEALFSLSSNPNTF